MIGLMHIATKRILGWSIFALAFICLLLCMYTNPTSAVSASTPLYPNSDPASPKFNTYPTTGGSRSAILGKTSTSTSTWVCDSANADEGDLYGLTDTGNVYQGVTSLTVQATGATGAILLGGLLGLTPADDQIVLDPYISGAGLGSSYTASVTGNSSALLGYSCSSSMTYDTVTQTWTNSSTSGVWTKAQIDGMQLYVGRHTVSGANPLAVAWANVSYTYANPPTLDQSQYQIYQNADSTTPGASLAASNTAVELPAKGQAFRIRLGMTVKSSGCVGPDGATSATCEWWRTGYGANKLQFGVKPLAGACSAVSSWSDVTASSAIAWNDNAGVADGAALGSVTGTTVPQQYRESNDFVTVADTQLGNTALWDFSLKDNSSSPGTTYCFRAVNTSGSIPIASYSQYPQVTVVGTASFGIVDGSGSLVANPQVAFGSGTVATTKCSQSSGTLGTPTQMLEVTNDIDKNGWNLTIAPTNGAGATWQSATGSYDFNDPGGCSDNDGDGYGGQLLVNPTTASSAAKSRVNCTNSTTGISFGPSTGFSITNNAITIVAANSQSSRFCTWDVTGVDLEQQIPPQTPAGSYSLDMTITMTAL